MNRSTIDQPKHDASLDCHASSQTLLLTAAQLAGLLGISTRSLWRLRSGRKLPEPVKVGGSVRWRTSDISTWLDAGCPAQFVKARG